MVTWDSGMAFTGHQDGCEVKLDAGPELGGSGMGLRPKTLLLTALGGCTGMDVVSILRKMRVSVDGFRIRLQADLTEEHPRVFSRLHVQYVFKGVGLPMDKLQRAVSLSQDTYCGVSAMLGKTVSITYEIVTEA